MATTAATLLTARDMQACWVLLIEGLPVACTTWDSNSQMQTAYAGTDYSSVTWFRGLEIVGNISQRINLFDSKVDWEDISFRVVDEGSDRLAGLVCRESHATAFKTVLTASFDNNDTTMTVQSTAAFASSGTVYLGGNTYAYTGKTATTFTGCSPKYALFTTSGGSAFADYHAIPTDETGSLIDVWSAPRSVYNRRCALYLHHIETGAPVTKANASLRWAGRIKQAPKDNGDGSFTFSAWSLKEDLNRTLLDEQYTATIADGTYLKSAITKVQLNSLQVTTTPTFIARNTAETAIDFPITPAATYARRTHEDLRDGLNATFNTWTTGGTIWPTRLRIGLVDADGQGEMHYQILATLPDTTNFYKVTVTLDARVWEMLGWPVASAWSSSSGIKITHELERKESGSAEWLLTAPGRPMTQMFPLAAPWAVGIDVSGEAGVWADQPTMPSALRTVDDPSNPGTALTATGFLRVGDLAILAVHRRALGSTPQFWIVQNVTKMLAPLGTSGDVLRWGGTDGESLSARQVWIEHGVASDMLLKIAASTGTAAYNSSLDVYPRCMGLGIPYSLLDGPSWALMSRVSWWLILSGPTPFLDLLESALAIRNSHVVWRSGKLYLRQLGLVPPGSEDWTLTESNKAGANEGPDRTIVTRGATGIINNALLHYNADINGKFRDKISVALASSIADFGKSKTQEIKGWGVYPSLLDVADAGLHDWATSMATSMAHWSRPIALAERTIDLSLADAAPGDSVSITDSYAVSPTLGTRGLSTWPGYITAVDFDWTKPQASKVTVALFPEADPAQNAAWSPSAQVASSSVAASKLTVTCDAHKYSDSAEAADASHFDAGDKCLIYEASAAAGTTYALTVDSQSGNNITFTTDPTTGNGLSALKRWVVTYDDIALVVSAQKAKSFIADSADTTTGDSTYIRYNWGGAVEPGSTTTATYTNVYRKIVNQADNKGEPLAVHWFADAVYSLNNILSYKTQIHPINQHLVSEQSQTGTTHKLVYGPVWVEWYGGARRAAKVMARMKTSANTATARFICSSGLVRGTSSTTTTYGDGGIISGDVTTTSTGYVYTSETAIAVPWRTARNGNAGGFWLTVEIFTDNAGATAYLDYVSLRETEI